MLPIAAIGLLVVSVLLIAGGMMLRRGEGKSDEKRIARQKKELMEEMPNEAAVQEAPSERAPQPALKPTPQPQAPQPQTASQAVERAAPSTISGPPAAPDEVEILQVRRIVADGRLALSVFGKVARSPEELSSGQADQLKRVLVELYTWLGKPGVASGTDTKKVEEPAARQAPAPQAPAPPAPNPPPANQPPVEISPDIPFAESLPKTPDLRDRLTFGRRAKQQLPEAPETPKSIVEQIDAILQAKLAVSPLAGRDIRMVELPGEGMMIVDGIHKYNGLDEVKDPELLAMLRASVKEWDESNRLRPGSNISG
jgi:hypothetical protein